LRSVSYFSISTSEKFCFAEEMEENWWDIPRYATYFYTCRSHTSGNMGAVWNSLPSHITVSPTLSSFKSALKTYLFTLAFPT
jgi:hypothetical protein